MRILDRARGTSASTLALDLELALPAPLFGAAVVVFVLPESLLISMISELLCAVSVEGFRASVDDASVLGGCSLVEGSKSPAVTPSSASPSGGFSTLLVVKLLVSSSIEITSGVTEDAGWNNVCLGAFRASNFVSVMTLGLGSLLADKFGRSSKTSSTSYGLLKP